MPRRCLTHPAPSSRCRAAAMTIQLYNTLGGRKQVFKPTDPGRVTMYVCGPTVYGPPHLGNARSAVVFDLLYRLLRHRYPRVLYARNITDIDDKIQAAAREEGVGIEQIAARYTDVYHRDMRELGVLTPSLEPRATENLEEMRALIGKLLDFGYAYEAEGHVFFSVADYARYGELSGRRPGELLAGARVEPASCKRDPMDFVLWKPSTAEQPGWSSPWGRGRPGWHTECSAMVLRYLGPGPIDLHGGGRDLIFPHHENEIAQAVAGCAGREFCRYWVHNGFVRVQREKMSKSKGNVLLVRELLREASGEVLRCALLSTHYRHPLEWGADSLRQARRTLKRLYDALPEGAAPVAPDATPPEDFLACLEDDLNSPAAITCLHALARKAAAGSGAERRKAVASLRAAGALCGLLQHPDGVWRAPADGDARRRQADRQPDGKAVEVLLEARRKARQAGDYSRADEIRASLSDMGVRVYDQPDGNATWGLKHGGE